MTTVLLVDDHPLVRAGLRTIIEATGDVTVVGEATDGRDVTALVSRLEPDVVLMDLSMPHVDGVEATRALREADTPAAIVVLTSFAETEQVHAALAAGAVGYLLKDSEPAEVVGAIRAAAAGHVPIDPRVAKALLPQSHSALRDDPLAGLSAREREVLSLVAKGMANKQVARALGISERTVKVHLGNVFRQIGVADRTSAALWARDQGLT